jgi:hypothetical protein
MNNQHVNCTLLLHCSLKLICNMAARKQQLLLQHGDYVLEFNFIP